MHYFSDEYIIFVLERNASSNPTKKLLQAHINFLLQLKANLAVSEYRRLDSLARLRKILHKTDTKEQRSRRYQNELKRFSADEQMILTMFAEPASAKVLQIDRMHSNTTTIQVSPSHSAITTVLRSPEGAKNSADNVSIATDDRYMVMQNALHLITETYRATFQNDLLLSDDAQCLSNDEIRSFAERISTLIKRYPHLISSLHSLKGQLHDLKVNISPALENSRELMGFVDHLLADITLPKQADTRSKASSFLKSDDQASENIEDRNIFLPPTTVGGRGIVRSRKHKVAFQEPEATTLPPVETTSSLLQSTGCTVLSSPPRTMDGLPITVESFLTQDNIILVTGRLTVNDAAHSTPIYTANDFCDTIISRLKESPVRLPPNSALSASSLQYYNALHVHVSEILERSVLFGPLSPEIQIASSNPLLEDFLVAFQDMADLNHTSADTATTKVAFYKVIFTDKASQPYAVYDVLAQTGEALAKPVDDPFFGKVYNGTRVQASSHADMQKLSRYLRKRYTDILKTAKESLLCALLTIQTTNGFDSSMVTLICPGVKNISSVDAAMVLCSACRMVNVTIA